MYVCCCLGVTDRTILLELGRGARSVEDIQRCTGASTRCGSCRSAVAAMVLAYDGRRDSVALVAEARPPFGASKDAEPTVADEVSAA